MRRDGQASWQRSRGRECDHRSAPDRLLTGGYRVETVEECVTEPRRDSSDAEGSSKSTRSSSGKGLGSSTMSMIWRGPGSRSGSATLRWTKGKPISGRTLRGDATTGSSAGPIEPACVAGCGSGSGRGWYRWRDSSMTSGIDREWHFARRIPGSGTTGCSQRWWLSRMPEPPEADSGAPHRESWRRQGGGAPLAFRAICQGDLSVRGERPARTG